MQTLLDGRKLSPAGPGIAEALEAARHEIAGTGRLLTSVLTDGQPMPDEWLDQPPSTDNEVKELSLTSEPLSDVLVASLHGASSALEAVRGEQEQAAEHLQAGEIAEAFTPLTRVLETWMMVRTVVGQAGELAGIDLAGVQVDTEAGPMTGSGLIADLAARLEAVRDAMSNEDWGGLSDELAYDLADQADVWGGLVRGLAGRVESSN